MMAEIKVEDVNKRRVGTCVGQPRRKIKLEANPFVISDTAIQQWQPAPSEIHPFSAESTLKPENHRLNTTMLHDLFSSTTHHQNSVLSRFNTYKLNQSVGLSNSVLTAKDLMNTRIRGKTSNMNSSQMDYQSTTVGMGASTGLQFKRVAT